MNKLIFLFLFTISATAQIKGVIKDSLTKEPIAFVKIFTEEKTEYNSEINGTYNINTKINSKITFQMFGYQTKVLTLTNNLEIFLQPKSNEIQEVIIQSKKKKLFKEIDLYESYGFRYHNWNNGCAVLIKNDSTNNNCKFIEKIKFHTDSKIDNSTLKFYILENDEKNNPDNSRVLLDSILTIKKGGHANEIDLSEFNFKIPENGLFLCFEKILVKGNKYFYEKTGKMPNEEKKTFKGMFLQPEISLVPSNELLVFYRRNDIWNIAEKVIIENPNSYENLLMKRYHNKVLTPSIKIKLSN